MSDILIKGMEMPKKCYNGTYCPFFYCDYNGGKHCSLTTVKCLKTKRPDGCPLVALPEHHGRLGDLDKLLTKVNCIDVFGNPDNTIDRIIQAIEDAPTIVEATE